MDGELFFERYRICRDPQGKPEEAGRTGAAITYKAVDEQTHEPVVLQLLPLAAIDPDRRDEFETRAEAVRKIDHVNVARVLDSGVQPGYFAFVTEYLSGDTADTSLVDRGTMTVDAVLRIGLQVVRATAAAAYHGLTHRAIQPSNIIILHGEAPAGGWPFIKLLNLGIAALELHGETIDARELAPAVVPEFASPEQVRNQQIDFRSEMYSLGATMCFLLTGAVPLPESEGAMGKRRGRRQLPQLRSTPKPVRRLLGTMLAENPEDRPQDPVVLERVMAACLAQVERRQAMARKLGIPLAVNVQRKIARSPSPVAQVVRGAVVVAAIVIALATLGAILRQQYFHRARSIEEIGVPVGVPTAEATNAAPPVAATSPAEIVSAAKSSPAKPPAQTPAVVEASPALSAALAQTARSASSSTLAGTPVPQPPSPRPQSKSGATQAAPTTSGSLAQNPPPRESTTTATAAKPTAPSETTTADAGASASASLAREPESPSEKPDDQDASLTTSRSKDRTAAREKVTRRSKTKSAARSGAQIREWETGRWTRAYFVGMTPGGRMLFRLPSGEIVAMASRHRRAPIAVRPRIVPLPPEPPAYFAPPPYGYPLPGDD